MKNILKNLLFVSAFLLLFSLNAQGEEFYIIDDNFENEITAIRGCGGGNGWLYRIDEGDTAKENMVVYNTSEKSVTLNAFADGFRKQIACISKNLDYGYGEYFTEFDYGSEYEFDVRMKIDNFIAPNKKVKGMPKQDAYSAQLLITDKTNCTYLDIYENEFYITTAVSKDGNRNIISQTREKIDLLSTAFAKPLDNEYHDYKIAVSGGMASVYLDDELLGEFSMANAVQSTVCDIAISVSASETGECAKATVKSVGLKKETDKTFMRDLKPAANENTVLKNVGEIASNPVCAGEKEAFAFPKAGMGSVTYTIVDGDASDDSKAIAGFTLYCAFNPGVSGNYYPELSYDGLNFKTYTKSDIYELSTSNKNLIYDGRLAILTLKPEIFENYLKETGNPARYVRFLLGNSDRNEVAAIKANIEYTIPKVTGILINNEEGMMGEVYGVDANNPVIGLNFNTFIKEENINSDNVKITSDNEEVSYTAKYENGAYKLYLPKLKYNARYTVTVNGFVKDECTAVFETVSGDITVTNESITSGGGKSRLKLNVKNNTSEKIDKVTLVFVSYKDGEMIDCAITEKSVSAQETLLFETDLIASGGQTEYYIAKGLTELTPLYSSKR